MLQSQARTTAPFGSALSRARSAVKRAAGGCETHLDLETEARPVLAMLLNDGALEQALLLIERDGPSSRVAIMPRRASGPPTLREIFEEDHTRLDALADALCEEAKGHRARTVPLADMFVKGLRRHIRLEEEVLFPLLERHAGPNHRAETMHMRHEHKAIDCYVVALVLAMDRFRVARGKRAAVDDLLRARSGLAAILADHNVKEERRLFPIIDRASSPNDRDDLLRSVVLF